LRLHAIAALLVLSGCLLRSHDAYLEARQDKAILDDRLDDYVAKVEQRFIDLGVELRVVVADPDGDLRWPGKPRMRVLRTHCMGGMYDTKTQQLRPSKLPRIWYASEAQERILLDRSVPAQLVEGSEGAGKTTVLAQWHFVQWMRHLGERREGLQTAPTNLRLGLVKREIGKLWRPEWFTYVTRKDFVGYELCDGSAIRMVSTHKQSDAGGSPVQGFNSSWAGADEKQDQVQVHDDIESRGREARDGFYPQLATATVKDSTEYENLRAKLEAAQDWSIKQLVVCRSVDGTLNNLEMCTPFVTRAFIESKKRVMSEREFRRRFFAERLPHELAVFYAWLRSRNLRPIPDIGAIDVTPTILAPYQSYMRPGARFTRVAGHDPGSIFNTTEVACLKVIDRIPRWVVDGELQTKQTSAHEHARLFREYMRRRFYLELPDTDKVATFVDPHGKGDSQTDYQTVYGAFQANSMDVFNPAPMTGRIKRSARIDMTNRLLGDWAAAPGTARIIVATARGGEPRWDTERREWTTAVAGEPLAPALVEGFDKLVKRPGEDDPEGVRKKDESDRTHGPAALGYLLWSFEQQALTEFTMKAALAAAGVRA
jgi:hypothetical protein